MTDWTTVETPVVDIAIKLSDITSATSLTLAYQGILADTSNGDMTLTLPEAADSTSWLYIIKNIGTNTVTIDADGDETIDGESYIKLTSQYSYVSIISDGTEWWIIGGMNVKLEEILERLLSKQIELLEKILITNGKSVLHLASMSDENIKDKDASDA